MTVISGPKKLRGYIKKIGTTETSTSRTTIAIRKKKKEKKKKTKKQQQKTNKQNQTTTTKTHNFIRRDNLKKKEKKKAMYHHHVHHKMRVKRRKYITYIMTKINGQKKRMQHVHQDSRDKRKENITRTSRRLRTTEDNTHCNNRDNMLLQSFCILPWVTCWSVNTLSRHAKPPCFASLVTHFAYRVILPSPDRLVY